MKKKLEDTTRPDDIIVKHTDGGVRLFLNSGAYEMLKIATDEFYSIEDNGEIVYKKTTVQDKQGHQVETRYKAMHWIPTYYTLNKYKCIIQNTRVL